MYENIPNLSERPTNPTKFKKPQARKSLLGIS
jgi:hypothetical protein